MKKEKGIYDLLVDKNELDIDNDYFEEILLDDDNFADHKNYLICQISKLFKNKLENSDKLDLLNIECEKLFGSKINNMFRLFSNKLNNKKILFNKPIYENHIYQKNDFAKDFRNEFMTCNEIKIISPFIMGSMLESIRIWLEKSIYAPNEIFIKILTTTYDGNSSSLDLKKLKLFYDELISKGYNIEIKIEDAKLIPRGTRIHSKYYSFVRTTKFSSTYIGSSNLTGVGVFSGTELNTKISEFESPKLFMEMNAVFENMWTNSSNLNKIDDEIFFKKILEEKNSYAMLNKINAEILNLYKNEFLKNNKLNNLLDESEKLNKNYVIFNEIKLKEYQIEALNALSTYRKNNKKNNLLVMATGTGKTVVAVKDYVNFSKENNIKKPSLLFLSHQKEILEQASKLFSHQYNTDNFGSMAHSGNYVDWEKEDIIFSTTQTLQNNIDKITNKKFDIVVYDEVHHFGAEGNKKLFNILDKNSKYLLGLTATPEREDGVNIKDEFFGGEISYELRLYDAVNEGMLSDFDYYMINDDEADLSHVKLSDTKTISRLLSKYDRNKMILKNIQEKTTHLNEEDIRGVIFCQSIEHSKNVYDFMINNGKKCFIFNSETLKGIERNNIIDDFKQGLFNYLIVVDMLNEGIDIPDINVVLFARPTSSLTLFTQQLGRGLRKSGNKRLTVLDFVNNIDVDVNKDYNPLMVIKAITQGRIDDIDNLNIPGNSVLILENATKEKILKSIEKRISNKKSLMKNAFKIWDSIKEKSYNEIYSEYDSYIKTNFFGDIEKMYSEKVIFIRENEYPVIFNDLDKSVKYNFLTIINNYLYLNNKMLIHEIINVIKNKQWSNIDLVNGIINSPFTYPVKLERRFSDLMKLLGIIDRKNYIFNDLFKYYLLEICLMLEYKLNNSILIVNELNNNPKCLVNTYLSKPQINFITGLVSAFECKYVYESGVMNVNEENNSIKKYSIITKESEEVNKYGYTNKYDKINNIYYWPTPLNWTEKTQAFKNLLMYPNNFYFFNRDLEFNKRKNSSGIYMFIGVCKEVIKYALNDNGDKISGLSVVAKLG